MKRLWLPALSAIAFLWAPMSVRAAVVFDIEYDIIADRVRPQPMANIHFVENFQITLTGKNQVAERKTFLVGGARQTVQGTGTLGEQSLELSGGWTVISPKKLVRNVESVQFKGELVVSVSGNACRASIKAAVKPGVSGYQYPDPLLGGASLFNHPRVARVSCAVRSQD